MISKLLPVLFIVFSLTACIDTEKTSTLDVFYENFNLYWTDVNASNYEITIDNVLYESVTPSLDVSLLESDTYDVSITAQFDHQDDINVFETLDIDHYLYYETVNNIRVLNAVIRFDRVEKAVNYDVWINGIIYETETTSFEIPDYREDAFYQIRIKANYITGGRYSRGIYHHTKDIIEVESYYPDPTRSLTYEIAFDQGLTTNNFFHEYTYDFFTIDDQTLQIDLEPFVLDDVLNVYIIYHDGNQNKLIEIMIYDANYSYISSSKEVSFIGDDLTFDIHLAKGSSLIISQLDEDDYDFDVQTLTIKSEAITQLFELSTSDVLFLTYYFDGFRIIIGNILIIDGRNS